jgi:glycosyltransferase involved in cell wall biosynthesis
VSRAPVSVVVPMHDGERYVGESLDSIFAQTVMPAEVIVVDDGSTDGSAAIVERYGRGVALLRQAQSGPAAARNRGIAAATQPLLAFLDHDDVWLPSKLETQLAALRARPDLDGVFCHMVEFISPDVPAEVAVSLAPIEQPQPSTLISCLLVSAQRFRGVGDLDTASRADFVDWYLRALDAGLRFEILPELFVRRRLHGRNTSRRNDEVKRDYIRHIKASLDRRRTAGARGEGVKER